MKGKLILEVIGPATERQLIKAIEDSGLRDAFERYGVEIDDINLEEE